MNHESSVNERLRRAESAVAQLRDQPPSEATPLPLARALLDLAEVLEERAEMPPAAHSEELQRALRCVTEISEELGAARDPALDDIVFEALSSRLRLLVLLGRPGETASIAAAIRARIGGDDNQLERARQLHAEAAEAYSRVEQDPLAVHAVLDAVERLGAPYVVESPAPPDKVVSYLLAGLTLAAGIAIYHGQPDTARASLELGLKRFGSYSDPETNAELEYARQLLNQL